MCSTEPIAIGVAVLFSTYFVLNLEYQAGAMATLEFIQR